MPGVRIELIQLLQDMLGDLEGNPEPIEVKLFGDDEAELRRQASRVADAHRATCPASSISFDGQVACSPERAWSLDPLAAGRLGLTTDDDRRAAARGAPRRRGHAAARARSA